MSQYIKNLPTPIVVVGMGKSGQAAKELLHFFGHTQVYYFDDKNPSADYTESSQLTSLKPQTLVVSPGYPLSKEWIQAFKKQGGLITSELSLAASCLSSEKLIGVTGSVAKSTTVSILEQGAKAIDTHSFTGGNLGTPFATYAQEVLQNKRPRAQWVILELSSYQLENCENLRLDAAAITYLSSNHLERYSSLEHYYNTKLKISQICSGPLFVNRNGGDVLKYTQSLPGLQIVNRDNPEWASGVLKKSQLIGLHNQDNMALALSISRHFNWNKKAEDAMLEFKGLAHRLETVAKKNGVLYINDSKATAMDSVEIAVSAALSQQPPTLHLLIGGKDKNLPWENLQKIHHPKLSVYYFGQCGPLAKQKMNIEGPVYPKLGLAFQEITKHVQSGDIVLLSPGGTSLDEFTSFEERGNYFKNLVTELL